MDKEISKIKSMLKLATDATHDGLEVNQLKVLLNIAEAKEYGVTISELAERSGYAQGSCSRLVYILSKTPPKGRVGGYGLVQIFVDDKDTRYKRVKLTPKGLMLINGLFKSLWGKWHD